MNFSSLAFEALGYRFDLKEGGILTSHIAYNGTSYQATGDTSGTTYYTSTFGTAIAYGAIIENAIGSSSNDTIIGNSSNNYLSGNSGNDGLSGNAGDDTLTGGLGNDYLDGGIGNDYLDGGTGNDSYAVDSTGDVIVESLNQGSDTVNSSVKYSLGANLENLTLTGTAYSGYGNTGLNTLTGNEANNLLSGKSGDDTLLGLIGSNRLVGGLGADILTGGAGADRFIRKYSNTGVDTITDFNVAEDHFLVSASGFGGGLVSGTVITIPNGQVRPELIIRKGNTKGKLATRTIPVFEDLRSLLTSYQAPSKSLYLFPGLDGHNHINVDSAARVFKKACMRVGIYGASTHSLRRTALTQMSDAGIPLRIIQEVSGHRNLSQLQKYLEVRPEQVRGAIASLAMISPVGNPSPGSPESDGKWL